MLHLYRFVGYFWVKISTFTYFNHCLGIMLFCGPMYKNSAVLRCMVLNLYWISLQIYQAKFHTETLVEYRNVYNPNKLGNRSSNHFRYRYIYLASENPSQPLEAGVYSLHTSFIININDTCVYKYIYICTNVQLLLIYRTIIKSFTKSRFVYLLVSNVVCFRSCVFQCTIKLNFCTDLGIFLNIWITFDKCV